MNVCGWLPMIIQLRVGDFGFGCNICGFEASSLTMVLLYALLCVHTLPLSPFPSQHLDSNKSITFGSNTGNTSTSGTPKPPSDLASKLEADGRLTQQERQCRMDQNLCLFCGKPGHMAKDCNKAAAAKAHAASAIQDTSSSVATEPKH